MNVGTIDKTSGSNNGTINLIVTANESSFQRETTIILSSNATDSVTITITQEGKSE